jgi:prepilin peptidase CpaA
MNLFTLPPQKVEMVLLVLLLTAAVFDVLYRRIPNWLTVSGVVLGIAMNALIGSPEAGLVFSLVGLAVAFGIYVVLYALRAMGAGDVSFILSEMKSLRPAYLANEELDVKNKKALGLPHGAVIAVSTVFYLALSARLAK